MRIANYLLGFLMLVALALTVACKNDDDASPSIDLNDPNQYVNKWIKENMDIYYFWNKEIPASTDMKKSPNDYFYSILSRADRFSWIQDNFQELLASLQGVSTDPGYEVRYVLDADSANLVFGQVLYVKPNSPASTTGLKRGDLITHVNGARLNTSNYQAASTTTKRDPHNFRFRRYEMGGTGFENFGPVNITPVQYAENPNYLDTVYQIEGKRIGYYVYNQFSSGPTSSSKVYQDEMDQIFAKFKNANIDELILDLRYNGGGSLDVSINLASLIAKGITPLSVYSKRKYNSLLEEAIKNDPRYPPNFLENNFVSKAQNIGNQIPKLYVLTGRRTASASEVLINGIKPFNEVFMIGDSTVGKNQGSISLYEENDPKNKWGMQPIILFITNGRGESDFINGFSPNIYDRDVSRRLYPLGDIRENLLSKAIGQITGVFPARILPTADDPSVIFLHDSFQAQPVQLDDDKSRLLMERGIIR